MDIYFILWGIIQYNFILFFCLNCSIFGLWDAALLAPHTSLFHLSKTNWDRFFTTVVSNSSHSSILMPLQCDFIIASGIKKDLALSLDPWSLGWAVWLALACGKRPRRERGLCIGAVVLRTLRPPSEKVELACRGEVVWPSHLSHPCQQPGNSHMLEAFIHSWLQMNDRPRGELCPLSPGHTAHPLGHEHSRGQFKPLACRVVYYTAKANCYASHFLLKICWVFCWVKSESKPHSCVRFFMTPWTVARPARLSMGFSRQEHRSG